MDFNQFAKNMEKANIQEKERKLFNIVSEMAIRNRSVILSLEKNKKDNTIKNGIV